MKKKLLASLLLATSCLSITACDNKDCNTCKTEDITLEQLNEMLNDSDKMNMDLANTVAIVPFNHINGPRNEWKFYALINFVYKERKYVKYQVTYISCTCRSSDVNYWQTAYIEINLPKDGQSADDCTLKKLSFDKDGTGHYLAGFWGDSNPICDEATGKSIATYEKQTEDEFEAGQTVALPSIKEEFIPLLIGKTKKEIDSYSTIDDMSEKVNDKAVASYFSGASVSTNNIIRILQAVFNYHAETYCVEEVVQ